MPLPRGEACGRVCGPEKGRPRRRTGTEAPQAEGSKAARSSLIRVLRNDCHALYQSAHPETKPFPARPGSTDRTKRKRQVATLGKPGLRGVRSLARRSASSECRGADSTRVCFDSRARAVLNNSKPVNTDPTHARPETTHKESFRVVLPKDSKRRRIEITARDRGRIKIVLLI